MTGTILPNAATEYLDPLLLDEEHRLRALLPAAEFLKIEPLHLKLWCHRHARYGLPTAELVDWLHHRIAGRSAIEIGAGNGDLGYLAGIHSTDSFVQQGEALPFYLASGQAPTAPGKDVEQLDALDAIATHRPQVVVAAWFTRKFEIGKDQEGVAQASVYGAREEKIFERVQTYIHIGHITQHSRKTLLRKRHEEVRFPGLLSRHFEHDGNVIYIWDK